MTVGMNMFLLLSNKHFYHYSKFIRIEFGTSCLRSFGEYFCIEILGSDCITHMLHGILVLDQRKVTYLKLNENHSIFCWYFSVTYSMNLMYLYIYSIICHIKNYALTSSILAILKLRSNSHTNILRQSHESGHWSSTQYENDKTTQFTHRLCLLIPKHLFEFSCRSE